MKRRRNQVLLIFILVFAIAGVWLWAAVAAPPYKFLRGATLVGAQFSTSRSGPTAIVETYLLTRPPHEVRDDVEFEFVQITSTTSAKLGGETRQLTPDRLVPGSQWALLGYMAKSPRLTGQVTLMDFEDLYDGGRHFPGNPVIPAGTTLRAAVFRPIRPLDRLRIWLFNHGLLGRRAPVWP